MRMLLTARLPHEPFNAAVRDGSAGPKIRAILDALSPEAVYFTEMNGQRTFLMITELEDPSKIPALAEPLFLVFNADVEFHVVMSADDLERGGLDEIGKKWR